MSYLYNFVLNIIHCDFLFHTEAFGEVTVLFSDIVTFTNIASACTPLDIVDMLNALYSRFDKLTTEHDVYKVRIAYSRYSSNVYLVFEA